MFVYLDTCVWLSSFITTDSKHAIAKSFFEDARRGKSIILVSHHVLNEILDVFKNKLVTTSKVRANPTAQELENLVKNKYRNFSVSFLRLPNVRIKNPNNPSDKLLRKSFTMLYKHLGNVKQDNKCPICKNAYNFIECDSVYEKDVLHALIAWNLNCDRFVTFDKDFEELKNDGMLSPMKIDVL